MSFRDRTEAGLRLAQALRPLASERPVIVALPRGGVPVAFEIARKLHAPLEVLIVRKVGAPGHSELGLGALVDGTPPQLVLNPSVMDMIRPSQAHVEAETRRQTEELERRRKAYIGDRTPLEIKGRTVILVDDGIATGGTIRAALYGLAQVRPARLVLAVPVAPPDLIPLLRRQSEEIICLETPEFFTAVGFHYASFDQTTDREVIDLLQAARDFGGEQNPD